ncbi:MAG: transglycosylase SLT domain-containing protein [Trueperaceae bacterium]|nr:transglycosylase SLT domain-containing protein [Trueperaceae bacterium]
MTWQQHNNGHRWRLRSDGRIEVESEGIPRTEGRPLTMATLMQDYGVAICHAADVFDIEPAIIAAMIAKESVREAPDWWRMDPTSFRREPSGLKSGGLMQTLLKTARSMNKKYELFVDVQQDNSGHVSTIPRTLEMQDLLVPDRSIMLGTAYLRHLADHDGRRWDAAAGADPVLLCAAYNAGGVYTTERNRWRLRTYGTSRIDGFIEYHNDFYALPKPLRQPVGLDCHN